MKPREYILRIANPFNKNKQRKSLILEVGRDSYGTSVLYTGDIFRVQPTQKPDLGIVIRCLAGYFNKSKIVSRSAPESSKLSVIAKAVADDNGLGLSFEVTDRNIANYNYTGSAEAQLKKLADLAIADVYQDNGILYIKDTSKPKKRRFRLAC